VPSPGVKLIDTGDAGRHVRRSVSRRICQGLSAKQLLYVTGGAADEAGKMTPAFARFGYRDDRDHRRLGAGQTATYLEEIQVLSGSPPCQARWISAAKKQAAECKHGQSVDVGAGPGELNGCFRVAGDDAALGRFAAEDRFKVRDIRAPPCGRGWG